ncbi:hypothetical protein [Trinickia sp.]|uniref:hypothetical protein n=1 Tax=Trinickia sp. TaxID=2571163 RepID=UPI003F7F33DF
MSTLHMWRWPLSQVKFGSCGSMVEDRGSLKRAIPNSRGWYQFSEHGDARRPLVLIGSRAQVLRFFQHNAKIGIENSISDLPHIYMRVSRYKPPKQRREVTPMNYPVVGAANVVVSAATNDLLRNWGNLGSSLSTIAERTRRILRPGVEESPDKTKAICVKFSYLPEPGMHVVGRRKVAFGDEFDGTGLQELFAE